MVVSCEGVVALKANTWAPADAVSKASGSGVFVHGYSLRSIGPASPVLRRLSG